MVIIVGVYTLVYDSVFRYAEGYHSIKTLPFTDTTARFYMPEKTYASSIDSVVLPFIHKHKISGTFHSDGHTIAYDKYLLETPRANVVISHGYTERKEKYQEVAYYFLKKRYQVFVLDHFSHGRSSRGTSDSSMVHINDYHVLVEDLQHFVNQIVKEDSKGVKTILFCHSMGGGIGARTVEEYPTLVDGLILNAPMMKFAKGGVPDFLAEPIAKGMASFGNSEQYALGNRAFTPETDKPYQPVNPATLSKTKGQYWHHHTLTQTHHPSHGASWGTAATFFDLMHDVVKKENVERITLPVLLFQAERDTYVGPEGHYEFARYAKNLTLYLIKDSGHEIYIENNRITIPYFNQIFRFIDGIKGK